MKGLLLKDIYCLKKQLKSFCYVTMAVLYVGVLFILSSRYGNIAIILNQPELAAFDKKIVYDICLFLTLFIPIAMGERVTACFEMDNKASFAKVFYMIPVSDYKKAGSRYVTALLYIALGSVSSLVVGTIVGSCSAEFTVIQILRVVAVLTAVMLMVMALLLCGIYLAGGDKSSVVLIVIMSVFLVPAYIYMVKKMYNMDEEGIRDVIGTIIEKTDWFLNNACIEILVMFLIAAVMMVVSYFFSVMLIKGKRVKL